MGKKRVRYSEDKNKYRKRRRAMQALEDIAGNKEEAKLLLADVAIDVHFNIYKTVELDEDMIQQIIANIQTLLEKANTKQLQSSLAKALTKEISLAKAAHITKVPIEEEDEEEEVSITNTTMKVAEKNSI
jgi:uncharacterized protein YaaW (UPF0174 family)